MDDGQNVLPYSQMFHVSQARKVQPKVATVLSTWADELVCSLCRKDKDTTYRMTSSDCESAHPLIPSVHLSSGCTARAAFIVRQGTTRLREGRRENRAEQHLNSLITMHNVHLIPLNPLHPPHVVQLSDHPAISRPTALSAEHSHPPRFLLPIHLIVARR